MSLTTTVEVDGIGHVIEFKGGKYFPEKINGTFATANVKIQKAIEEHERFGGDFILVRTYDEILVVDKKVANTPDPLPEPLVPAEEIVKAYEPSELPEPTTTTPTGEVVVSEVKNGQDAKLYLNKHFDVPFSRLKNNQMVMDEAKTANLLFPNWKL